MSKKIQKIEDLVVNPKNHNKGTERGGYALEESIRRLGAGRSGLADRNGVLIAGNQTAIKMSELGIPIKVVPTDGNEWVIVQRQDLDLETDAKAVELAYADNRTSELNFDLDVEQLKLDLDEDVDLSFLWTEEELREQLKLEVSDDDEELGGEGDRSSESVTPRDGLELGSIWQIGKHRLGCGDSTEHDFVLEVLDGAVPDIVWSDSPFGIKAASSYADGKPRKGLATVKRNKFADIAGDDSTDTAIASYDLLSRLFPKAVHIWWGANYFSSALPDSSCWIIWDKEQTSQFADAELAWTNQKSAVRIFRHQWNGMLKASERGEQRINPCQKPKAMVLEIISRYCKDGKAILDPFCGSGISILGGEELGMTTYAIELSVSMVELCLQRVEKALNVVAERVN